MEKIVMDVKYLKECFDYDAENGVFTWRRRPIDHFASEKSMKTANTTYFGKRAGHYGSDGRVTIGIKGKTYLANRLAIMFSGQKLEDGDVVISLDKDTFNLSLSNLYVVTMRDVAVLRESFNKNDDKCVYMRPNGKYQVCIGLTQEGEKRMLYGGVFDTKEQALEARNELFKLIYS